MSENIYDVIESHVLERNKYQSKFPTIEFKTADPESVALGINEKVLDWEINHHPVSNLNRIEIQNIGEQELKESGSDAISSGVNSIDAQRDTFIDTADKYGNQKAPTLSKMVWHTLTNIRVLRHRQRPYRLSVDRKNNPPRVIKGWCQL